MSFFSSPTYFTSKTAESSNQLNNDISQGNDISEPLALDRTEQTVLQVLNRNRPADIKMARSNFWKFHYQQMENTQSQQATQHLWHDYLHKHHHVKREWTSYVQRLKIDPSSYIAPTNTSYTTAPTNNGVNNPIIYQQQPQQPVPAQPLAPQPQQNINPYTYPTSTMTGYNPGMWQPQPAQSGIQQQPNNGQPQPPAPYNGVNNPIIYPQQPQQPVPAQPLAPQPQQNTNPYTYLASTMTGYNPGMWQPQPAQSGIQQQPNNGQPQPPTPY